MKKALLLIASVFSLGASAQNSISISNMSFSTTLAPNDTIYITTEAENDTALAFDITNTGSVPHVYNVKREDVQLNGVSYAYFCFAGQCYTQNVLISPDQATLSAGQSASQLSGAFNMLSAYLMEDVTIGKSIVRYTVYNTEDANDFRKFTIKYNYAKPVGIRETSKVFSSFEIFPNPANEIASILVSSPKAFVSSVILFNSLGQTVYQKEVNVNEGKNKIDLPVQNLQAGVYFASIKTGSFTVSKKLIIN